MQLFQNEILDVLLGSAFPALDDSFSGHIGSKFGLFEGVGKGSRLGFGR